MEHLPVSREHRSRLPQFAYYGIASKYDFQGFAGFPERHGRSEDELLAILKHVKSLEEAEVQASIHSIVEVHSFLQEWCWFGLLHEFVEACGQELDFSQATKANEEGAAVITTDFLPIYSRNVVLRKLEEQEVPLDLQVGDIVRMRIEHLPPHSLDLDIATIEGRGLNRLEIVECLEDYTYRTKSPNTDLIDEQLCPLRLLKRDTVGTEPDHVDISASCGFGARYGSNFTTTELIDLLAHKLHGPTSVQEQWRRTSMSSLAKSARQILRLLKVISSEQLPLHPDLHTSLRILCFSVQTLSKEVLGEYLRLEATWCEPNFPSSWCPSRTGRLGLLASTLGQEIATVLPSYDDRSHSDCETSRCRYSPQKSADIKPKHVEGCHEDKCAWFEVPEASIVDMLHDGGNPCFMMNENGDTLAIRDIRYQPYVAISHVWSQGLGNSIHNALPWCQIRRLCGFIKDHNNTALWIDTLSVPIRPYFKTIAISRLREVYKEATAVLILDRSLQQVGSHYLERQLQVLGCEWMTRLWTLQEGKLAKHLLIRFADGNIPLHHILYPPHVEDDREVFISKTSMEIFLKTLFTEVTDITKRFADLEENLAFRQTTEASDEPICLATLLGFDLEEFPYSRPTMSDIYRRLCRELPQDIVFLPGPKLAEPGLRWAPSTLLHNSPFGNPTYENGTLETGGFHITKDCILLEANLKLSDRQDQRCVYLIDLGSKTGCGFFPEAPLFFQPQVIPKAAVVLQKVGDRFEETSRGVLVEILQEVDSVYTCHFVAHVQVSKGESLQYSMDRYWDSQKTCSIQGQFHSLQQFCID